MCRERHRHLTFLLISCESWLFPSRVKSTGEGPSAFHLISVLAISNIFLGMKFSLAGPKIHNVGKMDKGWRLLGWAIWEYMLVEMSNWEIDASANGGGQCRIQYLYFDPFTILCKIYDMIYASHGHMQQQMNIDIYWMEKLPRQTITESPSFGFT